MKVDLGDVTLDLTLRVKGLQRLKTVWRIGAPQKTTAVDRVVNGPPYYQTQGKGPDLIMDLKDDNKVRIDVEWTDEVGNPVETPADMTAVYTVDDPTIINLTDNGDGTCVAAATGTLGTATVHGEFTGAGQSVTGDLQFVIVADVASRVNMVAGTPEHI